MIEVSFSKLKRIKPCSSNYSTTTFSTYELNVFHMKGTSRYLDRIAFCENNTPDTRNRLFNKDKRSFNGTNVLHNPQQTSAFCKRKITFSTRKIIFHFFIHTTHERQVLESIYLNTLPFVEPPVNLICRKLKSLSRVEQNSIISLYEFAVYRMH